MLKTQISLSNLVFSDEFQAHLRLPVYHLLGIPQEIVHNPQPPPLLQLPHVTEMSVSSTLSLLRNNSPVHLVSLTGNLVHPPLSRPLHFLHPSSECTQICLILSILPPMLVQSHHVSPRPLQWFPNWSLFQLL